MTNVTNHGQREAHERMHLHASEISIHLSIPSSDSIDLRMPVRCPLQQALFEPFGVKKISSCLSGFPKGLGGKKQRATRKVRSLGVLENTISGFTTYGMNACFSSNAPASFWNAAADSVCLPFLQATYDGPRRACPSVVGSHRRAPMW